MSTLKLFFIFLKQESSSSLTFVFTCCSIKTTIFLNGTHVCMKIIIDQQRIFAQMEAAATVTSRLENLQIMEQSVFSWHSSSRQIDTITIFWKLLHWNPAELSLVHLHTYTHSSRRLDTLTPIELVAVFHNFCNRDSVFVFNAHGGAKRVF